jgi:hypothetical protein
VACKALSPAVNDPYTAVQAVDHLSVIFCALARQPLGAHVARDGQGVVVVPARRFGDYLAVMCGLIRRYGASEPTVAHALLRLLGNCASVCGDDPERRAAIAEQARIIVADADREVAQPADLGLVHGEAESVFQAVAKRQPGVLRGAERPVMIRESLWITVVVAVDRRDVASVRRLRPVKTADALPVRVVAGYSHVRIQRAYGSGSRQVGGHAASRPARRLAGICGCGRGGGGG